MLQGSCRGVCNGGAPLRKFKMRQARCGMLTGCCRRMRTSRAVAEGDAECEGIPEGQMQHAPSCCSVVGGVLG